jgi:PKD repeat protein
MRFSLKLLFLTVLLTASYSHATEYTFEIDWSVAERTNITLDGFRLYDSQQNNVCETTDPAAVKMVCTVNVPGTRETYTLVSYSTDNIESDPSNPFTIVFEEPPLEAVINLTAVSLTVDFDGTASTGLITQYSWEFNDGSEVVHAETISHTFDAAGTYTISLTVQDQSGATETTTSEVTVSLSEEVNQPPTASVVINGPAPVGDAPLMVNFDASGSSDPEGSPLTYKWNFGDGAIATTDSGLISHQYTVAGNYRATVEVSDNQKAFDTETSQLVMVTEGSGGSTLPTATITASKYSGSAPLTITLSGTDSTPSESTGSISQYDWDFADGSTGSGEEVQHIFTVPGSYEVTLSITDSSGKQADTTKTIVVQDPGTQNTIPTLIQVYKLLLLNK